uniref:Uncharacterized protein n=1 Tax=Geladintestivirus 1 TaxID=3233133 RepID=A0AAU8MI48_9CAUD
MKSKTKTTKENVENKVVIITTEGCEACNIMSRIMRRVRENTPYAFIIEEYDFKDKNLLEKYPHIMTDIKVTDFPTVVLLRGVDNIISYNWSGTISVSEVKSIFNDINFI